VLDRCILKNKKFEEKINYIFVQFDFKIKS
jgi:hypothetical protein